MFTTVQAVSTSKTSWKKSYECETSLTIDKKTQSSNIHIYIKLGNRLYSYIFTYNYMFMYSKCKFNVDLY